jgi:hypothetical protein
LVVPVLLFIAPELAVAVAAGFAGFAAGLFLFCAANADVPASANANTTVISVFFINCPP